MEKMIQVSTRLRMIALKWMLGKMETADFQPLGIVKYEKMADSPPVLYVDEGGNLLIKINNRLVASRPPNSIALIVNATASGAIEIIAAGESIQFGAAFPENSKRDTTVLTKP